MMCEGQLMVKGSGLMIKGSWFGFLTTCDLMLKEKYDIPYAMKQGCPDVLCVIVS